MDLRDRIKSGAVLVCDGAMGTMLQSAGMEPGECPELWSATHADAVRRIHAAYREAGSDMVECNSFGGTHYKLRHYGLESRCSEINQAAARLAREVAGDEQFVLGSVGPTGQFLEPYGDETPAAFRAAFGEQIRALAEGGADAIIVETMTALEEAETALEAAREVAPSLVVMVSMTFDPVADGHYATMMGVTPEVFASRMTALGADVLATNCGTGIDDMTLILKLMASASSGVPLMAMPNAGMPVVEGGETVFKETPEQMAAKVGRLQEAGACIIGGCCGTSPAHIAAIRQVLRAN